MNTAGNTVLITGGSNGIGLALAERFLLEGSAVIVCGRREEKLIEAKQKFPKLHTRVCDVSDEMARQDLFHSVTREFPELNILVNNAGIQQRVNLQSASEDWMHYSQELAINLAAPIHLSMLFIPHLIRKPNAAIINISSGLALTPAAWAPVYSATKAALHSFSMSLRLQLSKTHLTVLEVLPPAVNTDLGGVGLHTFGAPLNDFADAVFQGFKDGKLEIGFAGSEQRLHASKSEIEVASKRMWENFMQNNPGFLS